MPNKLGANNWCIFVAKEIEVPKKNSLSIYDHHLNGILFKLPFLIWPLLWFHRLVHTRKYVVLSAAKRAIKAKQGAVTILDAGCGEGNFLIPLAHRFKKQQFFGLDLNTNLAKFVNAYGTFFKLRLSARQCDLNDFDEHRKFDIVLSVAVLHMLQDDKRFLRNVYSMLNAGGKLVLNVPIAHAPILSRWSKFANGYNVHYKTEKKFTVKEISELLERVGYKVVEKNVTNGWLGTLANELLNLSLQAIQTGSLVHKIFHSFLFSFVVFPCILILNLGNYFFKGKYVSGIVIVATKE